MNKTLRSALAIILTGIWVNASEFFRNELLLKASWVEHYERLGLTFPSAPLNAVIWMVWGFLYAATIYLISRKFNIIQSALISWLTGFVLMWLVTVNLNVLPAVILIYAVPLSLLEAFVGSYICIKVSPQA